jgi:hypothetical protein
LRRRALACVAKLAGSLGESMAWSGIEAATARQGRSKQRAEGVGEGRGGGVKNWEWMEKREGRGFNFTRPPFKMATAYWLAPRP